MDGLTPAEIPAQPTNFIQTVNDLCQRAGGPVRWVGMGPLTNLAEVLAGNPLLADQLAITQMGGAINYRDPNRAEHNFRLDPVATRQVIGMAKHLRLVISDVTFTDKIEITANSALYSHLAAPEAPAWAAILKSHLDRWYTVAYPGSMQHDPLTLTAALELPFVDFTRARISLDSDARMTLDPGGTPIYIATAADYPAFLRWLTAQLSY